MKIAVKRVYEPADKHDGKRVLVDRLWPRGLKKEDAAIDLWMKDAAPSTKLRKWFSHDVLKWKEFQRRYRAELDQNREALQPLTEASLKGPVTLLYGAHDTGHNNAVVLQSYLKTM
ncbi:MAG: DUF488 domain-containing protein [Chthoniobacteraceae bacterium]